MGADKINLEAGTVHFASGDAAFDVPAMQLSPSRAYWIHGRNGAGKTTLLRHLSEQLTTRFSTLFLDQAYDTLIYPYHTVWWNIAVPLILQGHERVAARQSAEEIVRRFNLPLDLKRRADRLSGGEQRIVTILRASLSDSKAILLDEPTASLDVSRRPVVWAMIEDMCTAGRLIILVSHEPPILRAGDFDWHLKGVDGAEIVMKEMKP